jgi:predicted phage tail protein
LHVCRGFTPYVRDDYKQWKKEGRLLNMGVHAQVCGHQQFHRQRATSLQRLYPGPSSASMFLCCTSCATATEGAAVAAAAAGAAAAAAEAAMLCLVVLGVSVRTPAVSQLFQPLRYLVSGSVRRPHQPVRLLVCC